MTEDLERIAAAARKTMATAGAIVGTMEAGGDPSIEHTAEWALEPAHDRFAIGMPYSTVIIDGVEYGGANYGRWWRRPLPTGTFMRADPRAALALCADGITAVTGSTELHAAHAFDLTFDRALADRLGENGLGARWTQVTGRATVNGFGHVLEVAVGYSDGSAVHERRWTLRWLEAPLAIAVPDPAHLIEYAAYQAELEEESYR